MSCYINSVTQVSHLHTMVYAPKPRLCTILVQKIPASPFGMNTYISVQNKGLYLALFTSYRSEAMPQPVEVKRQSEQQSLPHLHGQAATRCFGRELAFDHRENGFYFGARPIQLPRKSAIHLMAEFCFRNAPPRIRRDHAVGSQRAAYVAVIGFGVELRVRQHHPNGHGATSRVHQAGQSTRVAPRTLSRSLCQNDLAIHIDHDQPLQKVFVVRLSAGMLLDAAYEIGADGVLRKPGTVHRHASPTSAAARTAAQSAYRFSQRTLDGIVRQPLQEAIHGAVVGHARQSQDGAQLAMLAQPHFGFAESPVFVTHQAENGQQLRLSELVFAETTPVSRQNRRGYIHRHASKRQESDFGHRTSCPSRKHHCGWPVFLENHLACRGCKQSHLKPFRMNTYKKKGRGLSSTGTPACSLFPAAIADTVGQTSVCPPQVHPS